MKRATKAHRSSAPPRARHPALAALLWILAALAAGPVLDPPAPGGAGLFGAPAPGERPAGPDDPDRSDDGPAAAHLDVLAAEALAGGQATAGLPGPSGSAARLPDRPVSLRLTPDLPTGAMASFFDRVSYRTTGPPLRVS